MADAELVETRSESKKLQGLTGSLVFAICSTVFGSSFQFGYHTGVINAPQTIIQDFINATYTSRNDGAPISKDHLTFLWSTAVAVFAIGGMIGGISSGYFANRFGRKGCLLLNNILAVIGLSFMALSKVTSSYEMLIIGRLIIGINCGINTGAAPMYITEISPTNLRGAVGITNQVGITSAILFSQVMGLPDVLGTVDGWPYLLGLSVLSVVLQLCTLPFSPESPKFLLINRNKHSQAESALIKLRKQTDVHEEMSEMKVEYQKMVQETELSVIDLLKTTELRFPLVICIVLMLSQQLSGINAVLYYSTNIFITAGLSETDAPYATLGTGGLLVLMTFVSIPLIDSLGRRTLHLTGLTGMWFASLTLAISLIVLKHGYHWGTYIAIAVVIVFVMFFALGPGSIPWFYPAELFSQGSRGAAVAVCVLVNWLANFVVGQTYLPLESAIHEYTFLIFTGLLTLFCIFTYKKVPETKNRTIDEITALFATSTPQSADTTRL